MYRERVHRFSFVNPSKANMPFEWAVRLEDGSEEVHSTQPPKFETLTPKPQIRKPEAATRNTGTLTPNPTPQILNLRNSEPPEPLTSNLLTPESSLSVDWPCAMGV